jgi:hypothetical protein
MARVYENCLGIYTATRELQANFSLEEKKTRRHQLCKQKDLPKASKKAGRVVKAARLEKLGKISGFSVCGGG